MIPTFDHIMAGMPEHEKIFIKKNLDISDRIHELLQEKFGGNQKQLAVAMGKSEAEISKLLNGLQNYTQKTIAKFEAAFGEAITQVTTGCAHFDVAMVVPARAYKSKATQVSVSPSGQIESKFIKVQSPASFSSENKFS